MASASTFVVILRPKQMMRSSHALSLDILDTANRIAIAGGRKRLFSIQDIAIDDIAGLTGPVDLVILPGLGLSSETEIAAALADGSVDTIASALADLNDGNTRFATSCSGVFALAHAGLLSGRSATLTWWLTPVFSRLFPDVRLNADELVVEDGPIITAGAALAHTDLMIHIVERFGGYAIARQCMRYLVLDERRSQSSYASVAGMISHDPLLLRAERHVRKHMADEITVGHLADATGMAPRTFSRRLQAVAATTPIEFIQNLRVSRAMDLALTTRLTSDQIAAKVGYSDANALRRIMKKQIGKSVESLRN